jgi:hypothetical protein
MRPDLTLSIAQSSASNSGGESKRSAMLLAVLSGVGEGFAKARRYQTLIDCRQSELAALRVTQQDLPRFVMFG